MLKDDDLFPIGCPHCHEQTHKEIGRLKREGIIICSTCGLRMRFSRDEFSRFIDDVRKQLADFGGSIRPAEE